MFNLCSHSSIWIVRPRNTAPRLRRYERSGPALRPKIWPQPRFWTPCPHLTNLPLLRRFDSRNAKRCPVPPFEQREALPLTSFAKRSSCSPSKRWLSSVAKGTVPKQEATHHPPITPHSLLAQHYGLCTPDPAPDPAPDGAHVV